MQKAEAGNEWWLGQETDDRRETKWNLIVF